MGRNINLIKTRNICRALRANTSEKIISILQSEKELSVTDIYIRARSEQPVISQNLRKLRDVGLLSSRKEGKNVYYSLNFHKMEKIISLIEQINSLK